nr:hypothetical protein [Streptomyces sp. SM14]
MIAPPGRLPAVLSADAEAGVMVLEEVLPGTIAEDMPQTSLPQQWGELLAAPHAVALPAHLSLDLRGRLDEAFARIGRRLSELAIAARMTRRRGGGRDGAMRGCGTVSPGSCCCTAICASATFWTVARRVV